MNIAKDCLVLNLQVGTWMGYKLDKATTRRVTDEAGATSDAARVNKHIIPTESLKPVTVAVGRVRSFFYDSTLPWKDNGDRLLTRTRYMDFIEKFEQLKSEHDDAAEDFLINRYPKAKAQAEFRMGELFNLNDYPSADALRHKFYVNLDIDAVGSAFDARLDDRADILQARVNKAVQSLWTRLAAPLEKFSEKMNGNDIFRDSLVLNLREVSAFIGDLNLTGDPELEEIRQRIDTELAAYDPDDIRKDPKLRKALGDEAQSIIDTMSSFMAAFSGV